MMGKTGKTGKSEEFSRTYEDILKSYIIELNQHGADLIYEKLDDKQRLELLDVLLKESKKNILLYMKHIVGAQIYWFHHKWFKNWIKYRNICNVASRGCG